MRSPPSNKSRAARILGIEWSYAESQNETLVRNIAGEGRFSVRFAIAFFHADRELRGGLNRQIAIIGRPKSLPAPRIHKTRGELMWTTGKMTRFQEGSK